MSAQPTQMGERELDAWLTANGKPPLAIVSFPEPEDRGKARLSPLGEVEYVKSTDLDEAGRIVDVTPGLDAESMAFVTAQIDKHNRYLDTIRDRVRAGGVKLTAFLAKMLGLPFDEDGVEMQPSTLARPSVAEATKAMQNLQRAAGMPIDADTGLPEIGAKAADEERVRTIAAAAADRFAATGDISAALDELLAGVARTRPGKLP